MRVLKACLIMASVVVLSGLWGCDDKPTKPSPATHYPIYFAMAGINQNYLMYFKYIPGNGELDSFYLPFLPDEMAVSTDNFKLWICRSDSLYIVDIESKSIMDQMISPFGCSRFVFSRDDMLAASGGKQLRIINTADYSIVYSDTSIGTQGRFSEGDFSPDGMRYYCADCYNYLYRVDLGNNNEVTRWNLETHGGIYCARPSPDETKIFFTSQIAGSDYCHFAVFNIAGDSVISDVILGPYPVRFQVSANGRKIYITTEGNMFTILQPSFSFAIYDIETLTISQVVVIPSYRPQAQFFPLGHFVVTPDDRWLIGRWWADPTMVTYDLHTMDTTRFHRFVDREPINFTFPYKP